MTTLQTTGLAKRYADITAVDSFSHRFASGRITAILGPSGSGKSTTLAMIAGLLPPDHGRIQVDGRDITGLPPEQRGFGMVFQDHVLFPHLTVLENAEFGLRVRGVERDQRRQRAQDALDRLRVAHLSNRSVDAISGGERQRVAFARALAYRPSVLLLDEPFSALDAELREALRGEVKILLRDLAITVIHVTHDQIEALSLADEVVVMRHGRIEQAGDPTDVYRKPKSAFVARFLGAANVVPATCVDRRLRLPFTELDAPIGAPHGPCLAVIRSEDVHLPSDGQGIPGIVRESTFQGARQHLRIELPGGTVLTVNVSAECALRIGDPTAVSIRADRIALCPRDDSDSNSNNAIDPRS